MTKYLDGLKTIYKREKFLVLSNIAILTITFFILGFFLSTIVALNTAVRALQEQAQITLFFKDDFPESEIISLKDKLSGDKRINKIEYVSKLQAYEIFMDVNKDEPILLEAISKDILPASLEIHANRLSDLTGLATEFDSIDGVEEIKFFRDIIDKFRYWSNVVYVLGIVLVGIFLSLSFAIVMSTLRISIASKGDEIEIMKLVGATDSYVKNPLVFQGVFFGVVSSIIASLFLIIAFTSLKFFGFFGIDYQLVLFGSFKVSSLVYLVILVLLLPLLGAILGYLGSHTAIKKYLKY